GWKNLHHKPLRVFELHDPAELLETIHLTARIGSRSAAPLSPNARWRLAVDPRLVTATIAPPQFAEVDRRMEAREGLRLEHLQFWLWAATEEGLRSSESIETGGYGRLGQ